MSATRILIIRFSSIGDIVLTTPVIRRLYEQLDGEVVIHYLTKKAYAPLVESHPYVEKVYTIEKATAEVMSDLKAEGYDYIVDLHRNIRSAMVKRELKVLAFTLDKLNFQKWLLVNFGINRMPDKHIVDRYLDTIKAFGTEDDGKGLELFLPEGVAHKVDTSQILPAGDFCALAVGGAHEGKRMTRAQLLEITRSAPIPVVLLGGKEDMAVAKWLTDQCPTNVTDTCGTLSIMESAAVIQKATLVVAGDTGLMHIAAAFAKCVISVWGCTTPSLGMYPYRPHPASSILEPEGLTKRPCSKLGNSCKYGKGEERCISHIPPQRIIDALTEALSTIQKEP
ncbi:MAG: glycosyltransferase family 9 protein [Flavobacteriales bacterium]|nr:glycosyltransferase family 9 protein [Flavobacteriales bacterium]